MNEQANEQSRWRIDLAREVASYYGHSDIRMIVLGGSPSRNLSDAYSDLDIVMYWHTIDADYVQNQPLKQAGVERYHLMGGPENGMCLETYYIDSLKVDVEHMTLNQWDQWMADVLEKHDPTPWKLQSMGGFSAAVVLRGRGHYEQRQRKLRRYPSELAKRVIKQNMRFFVKDCLLNQGYRRGEMLFFYDGMCAMFKKLLMILGALNRMYLSMDEPRWIEHFLTQMKIKPDRCWQRIKTALDMGDEKSLAILDDLMEDVMALVKEHMPDVDTSVLQRIKDMAVRPCYNNPVNRL